MSAGFEEFTRAATRGATRGAPELPKLDQIAVLGGGADARLLAALCLAEGAEVTLFSAYGAERSLLAQSSGISLRGEGPVGTYQVDRDGPSVRTTAELDAAVSGAQVIFLTGPIHKQRTYAMVLADHLSDGQVLVLAPGRSLGAVETAWLLRIGGCVADVTLVEVQGLPYWFRSEGAGLTLSQAAPMAAATLPRGRDEVLQALSTYLPNLQKVESVLASGFNDLSAAVEIPALILGGTALGTGGPNVPMGGVPLEHNQTFASLIGPDQKEVIRGLADERRRIAAAFGVRKLPDTEHWVSVFAGSERGSGARPIPDQQGSRSMMRDGVLGSLVPLVSAGELAGIPSPLTSSLITMSDRILGADIAAAGRRLETIGISAGDVDQARRIFDTIVTGAS
ncbi:NAD/NADP octopine/nopaline dehydrogenase family protein [Ruegeria profundi]|uniref:NAD/NADP octopine/nopaline dehydrogenase family protein n=1 Tax=Ruegeria profundi TaxID=1685378 RepID=UPI001CD638F1|nr:NAD/NADP octopine/nopaline dehydrogenase family protein [Ruegeria profundi]MCA0927908.1 NAD/NADP octopine/nopaline dehydrogenase family protein [Ruegeria profundi]